MKLITLDNLTRAVRQLEAELPDTLVGATSSQNGESGVVPAPAIADQGKFLRGDGDWGEPSTITTSRINEIIASNTAGVQVTTAELSDILLAVYPVGSYYMSDNSTSPASLFGGTWERIQDRFLLAAGSSYIAGSTGGEAEHTLANNELPVTYGNFYVGAGNSGASNGGYGVFRPDDDSGIVTVSVAMQYAKPTNATSEAYPSGAGNSYAKAHIEFGGDQPHNNMPPYKAVYIWHRIL